MESLDKAWQQPGMTAVLTVGFSSMRGWVIRDHHSARWLLSVPAKRRHLLSPTQAPKRLKIELQRTPTIQEVAIAIGITAPRLNSMLFDAWTKRMIISAFGDPGFALPTRRPVGADGGPRCFADTPMPTNSSHNEDSTGSRIGTSAEEQRALYSTLARTLTHVETRTMCIRFGLVGRSSRPRSLEATAALMFMSEERVRCLLVRAQAQLREQLVTRVAGR